MKYILVLLLLGSGGNITATNVHTFDKIDDCFDRRQMITVNLGRPIRSYQAVCLFVK